MPVPQNLFHGFMNTLKLVSVEPYLFFCLFGYIIRLVSFQSLLMDSACRNWHVYHDEICNDLDDHQLGKDSSIEAGNNLYTSVMLISSLPAILVALFLGPWSDKYSRKYSLIIAATGMMLEALASGILAFYPKVSPVWYVVVALFAGFSGGFIMSMSAAFSYMSDVTDERSRASRYAFLEFSNIVAVVLGTSLGGQVFKAWGYVPVMLTATCSFGLAILYARGCRPPLYAAVWLKETRPRVEGRRCSDMMRDLVTVDNLKESYRTCSKKRPGNNRLQIWLLVWASCSQKFVDMGTLAIAFPFVRGMYSWDVTDFSHACTAFYLVNAIVTVVVVPLLANGLKLQEGALGLIGMLSLTAKMVLTSVAYYEPLFYFAWMSGALNNSAGIAIRSKLSKLVNKDEMGRAFSLLGTCESVTPLLGTLVFVQIYNASVNIFPGMAFAASAVFVIPSVVVFSWMIKLPTVSFAECARDDEKEKPMETYSSNNNTTSHEEKI